MRDIKKLFSIWSVPILLLGVVLMLFSGDSVTDRKQLLLRKLFLVKDVEGDGGATTCRNCDCCSVGESGC